MKKVEEYCEIRTDNYVNNDKSNVSTPMYGKNFLRYDAKCGENGRKLWNNDKSKINQQLHTMKGEIFRIWWNAYSEIWQ